MLRWPIGLVMLAACGSSSGSQDRADVFFENTEPVPRDPTHTNGWEYGCPDPTVL